MSDAGHDGRPTRQRQEGSPSTFAPARAPVCAAVAFIFLGACASLGGAPSFTHRGTEVKCVRDLPENTGQKMTDAAKLAIDVLQSDEFKARVRVALADSSVRHGALEVDAIRHLRPEDSLARVEHAGEAGFSIDTRFTMSGATNAWDGYDDPTCGRVVVLSRSKVWTRPEYLWAGTIIHELSHVAGFVHDGQRRDGNECTIPNLLGDIAEWTAWERTRPVADGDDKFVT